MKYIKQYENFKEKYKKGDYIIFKENRYKFADVVITAGKPYEIKNIIDNNFELTIVVENDNGIEYSISFFDDRIKKIPTKRAKMLSNIKKFNL